VKADTRASRIKVILPSTGRSSADCLCAPPRIAAPGIDLIAEGDISAGAVAARTAEAATGAMSRFLNEEHGLKRIFDKGSEDLLQLAQMPDEQLEATWPGCR
jgi:hypothetical protein